MISDHPKKRRTSAALTLALMAGMGIGLNLGRSPTPKSVKDKPIEFTPEDDAKLDVLYADKSSQGRKAYKVFKAELHSKYSK